LIDVGIPIHRPLLQQLHYIKYPTSYFCVDCACHWH